MPMTQSHLGGFASRLNPLTAAPPKIRAGFYWLYATVGVFFGGCEVWGADTLFGADLTRIMAVYAYLGIVTAATAGSNVPSAQDVADGDAPMPAPERGAVDVGTAVLIGVLVLLVLIVAGVLR